MRAASLITILQETIVNIMLRDNKELSHLARLSMICTEFTWTYLLLWCESEPNSQSLQRNFKQEPPIMVFDAWGCGKHYRVVMIVYESHMHQNGLRFYPYLNATTHS
jgi:hypothetical protein